MVGIGARAGAEALVRARASGAGHARKLLVVATLGLANSSAEAVARAAEESVAEDCATTYESAQELRQKQSLLAARKAFRSCARIECPAVIRTDCIALEPQVEREIPTIVLEANGDTGSLRDVTVTIDGTVAIRELNGKATELDPGPHQVRFELNGGGHAPIDQQFILRSGELSRLVSANFATPRPVAPAATADIPTTRPVTTPIYIALGVGAVGFAGFGVLGGLGLRQKGALIDAHCAPFCNSSQTAPARAYYIAADVSMGLGVAALVTAGILLLTRPSVPVSAPARMAGMFSVTVDPARSEKALLFRTNF